MTRSEIRETMTHTTVFQHVRIFDGARMLPADTIIVADGSIAAVGMGSELATPTDATIVEGAGQTVLPGLLDAHTHVMSASDLRQALIFGVTTELDMFTDWHLARQIKAQQAQGEGQEMADLRSAGTAVTAPGGHGTQFGPSIPTICLGSVLPGPQLWTMEGVSLGLDSGDCVHLGPYGGGHWLRSLTEFRDRQARGFSRHAGHPGVFTASRCAGLF
jgi:hypothetical protein